MSESAKILMKEATKLDDEATAAYTRDLELVKATRATQRQRYLAMVDAAQGVCSHSEEKRTPDVSYEDHGRTEVYYTKINCAICGKYLRNE